MFSWIRVYSRGFYLLWSCYLKIIYFPQCCLRNRTPDICTFTLSSSSSSSVFCPSFRFSSYLPPMKNFPRGILSTTTSEDCFYSLNQMNLRPNPAPTSSTLYRTTRIFRPPDPDGFSSTSPFLACNLLPYLCLITKIFTCGIMILQDIHMHWIKQEITSAENINKISAGKFSTKKIVRWTIKKSIIEILILWHYF